MVKEKIVPIEGDINKDLLALRPEDRELLMQELDVIINCAASVDFNEQITSAININYNGCMRMLDLAHGCRRLQIFTHVSTCYVNCEKKGFIKEQIYDIKEDSQEVIAKVSKLTVKEQEENLKSILGPWPNTYTFTKSMAERTLRRLRNPGLPTLLLRPAIIGGAMKEPYQGWTDTISAAGGLSLVGGIGLVNWIHGDHNNIADLIPVDICSNMIIAGTALQANKPELKVAHCASSHLKPMTWGEFRDYTFRYIKHHPYEMQLFKPSVKFIENETLFKTAFYFKNQLPVDILDKVSKIPGVGSSSFHNTVKKGKLMVSRAWETGLLFDHFTTNSWIYESKVIDEFLR